MALNLYIKMASGLLATVYGMGEPFCGDVGKPRPCDHHATTASGERLQPHAPTVAVAAPPTVRIPEGGIWVRARVDHGPCKWIRVTDKMSPRWIGIRGWDLTPGAVHYMTGVWPGANWSGVMTLCTVDKKHRPDPVWDLGVNLDRVGRT